MRWMKITGHSTHARTAAQPSRSVMPATLPPPRTVYFIRHGTSEWNLLGKWQGQTDTLLAPEGEAQAQREGRALADGGVRFDAVRCSDLKRAHRTARSFSDRNILPMPPTPKNDPNLAHETSPHRKLVTT